MDALPPSGRQLELVAGDARAVVVEVGGGLRTLSLGGREVVAGYAEQSMASGGRGQHLLPWPNRVGDGRWTWQDRPQQLALSEADKSNAIHGLVRWLPWEVVDARPSTAVLRVVVHPQPGWPGRVEATCTWTLTEAGLTAELTAVNRSPQPLPFGYGTHPYLAPVGDLVDEEELHVPAARRLLVDERSLPLGTEPVEGTAYDFRTARPIADTVLDTCFGDLERGPDGEVAVRFGSTEVWADGSFRWFQLFSGETLPEGQRRRSLAVEPMTCPPDALRSGTDLVVLEPGARWSGSWGVRQA